MPERTHTPGTWTAERETRGGFDSTEIVWHVYANDAPSGHKLPAVCSGPDAEANARLIAAAPEMHRLLLSLATWHGLGGSMKGTMFTQTMKQVHALLRGAS